jgi:hypothetical protein
MLGLCPKPWQDSVLHLLKGSFKKLPFRIPETFNLLAAKDRTWSELATSGFISGLFHAV